MGIIDDGEYFRQDAKIRAAQLAERHRHDSVSDIPRRRATDRQERHARLFVWLKYVGTWCAVGVTTWFGLHLLR